MASQKQIEANIWKYFVINLIRRRNYLPVLSLYFLSLPNTTTQQIGLYTGIGWIGGAILEIPSGYLSDTWGHKNTLVLASVLLVLATAFYVIGDSVGYFIVGAICMAFSFAFSSGTSEAFLHNTLIALGRDKKFAEIEGKIKAKVALASMIMILLLPLLTSISLKAPLQFYILFELLGIFIALSLVSPPVKYTAEDIEGEYILSQMNRFLWTGFYGISLFLGVILAVSASVSIYKEPFLVSLWFPILYIGSVMALSRLIWFVVGHNLHLFKNITISRLLTYEMIAFPLGIFLLAYTQNPYIAGVLFAIIAGYKRARIPLFTWYFLEHFVINKRYKATMFSIKKQISWLMEGIAVFIMGYLMVDSFHFGFAVVGISMFFIMLLLYPLLLKSLKE